MSVAEIEKAMMSVQSQVLHVMDEAMKDVARDEKQLISVPVQRTGNRVIRSRPGQPPRKDTGRLHGSVKGVAAKVGKDRVEGKVTTATPYDQFLEKGTSKMSRRPFAGPTEAKWGRIVENRFKLAARQFH
jgi:hypothetical protein